MSVLSRRTVDRPAVSRRASVVSDEETRRVDFAKPIDGESVVPTIG